MTTVITIALMLLPGTRTDSRSAAEGNIGASLVLLSPLTGCVKLKKKTD